MSGKLTLPVQTASALERTDAAAGVEAEARLADARGMRATSLVLAASCSSPAASSTPSTPTTTSTAMFACAAPEHRQLDFWIGAWDVAIEARSA